MCRGIWYRRNGTTMYGMGTMESAKERGIYPTDDIRKRGRVLAKKIDSLLGVEISKKREKNIYWRQKEGESSVSFYLPFGEKECKGMSSKFCCKYCYCKTIPFEKKVKALIRKTNMDNYDWETLFVLINRINAKYFTLFSSGCLENLNDWKKNIKKIAEKNPNKKFRFYIRKWNFIPTLSDNATIILSIDYTSFKDDKVLSKILKNKNIKGIAIVDHKINEEFIDWIINQSQNYGINKIIFCKDCKADGDGCGDDMLCFDQKERFILIQSFMK